MRKKLPIFYSALLLTGVNLLLRLAGTSFQVYLSGRIGPAGIGLLQLVLSVGSLAMVAGVAGIRTAAMYLTAEELGRGKADNLSRILSGCWLYSLICSGTVALGLYFLSPRLASHWIGDGRTVPALRLFAVFLPSACLCAVMTGYFTGANRIGTLAAVEVAEQLLSMGFTLTLLVFWAGSDPGQACLAVILGTSLGGMLTLVLLVFLRIREHPKTGSPIPTGKRILAAAAPLAAADILRSGISTAENLLVPKRLALYPGERNPLAAFGMVSGMVFPILMFPACILFGLSELLIPEMARCAAAGQQARIQYLTKRSLKSALVYALFCGGLVCLLAEPLCLGLYHSEEAGRYLKLYSFLIPILYCDAITDAITKGLGQQRICVRYNIITNSLDVLCLFLLLPKFGMGGYFFSFALSHGINFLLSLRLLCHITHIRIDPRLPLFSAGASITAQWIAAFSPAPFAPGAFLLILGSLLYLLQIVSISDLRWVFRLIKKSDQPAPVSQPYR